MTEPQITEHEDFRVVRDDLVPGGTKARALQVLFGKAQEYVYASPVYGYAQIALAHTAKAHGKTATVFCAKRNSLHPRTLAAKEAGANIVEIPCGYMSVVSARARNYCTLTGAQLLPFGLDDYRFITALADVIRKVDAQPEEVWCAAGSGVMCRALQLAWPNARMFAVAVGAPNPNVGNATVFKAEEPFEKDARVRPPFPSCSNYDAKVWCFMREHAAHGALFWNVAA